MTEPSAIADLLMWVDGRAAAYSDTDGTVLATPFAGRVRRVNYHAPLAGNAQAPSDALRPYRGTNSLNFQRGAGHYLAAPVASACIENAITMAFSFTVLDASYVAAQILLSNSSTDLAVGLFNDQIPVVWYNFGGGWLIAPAGDPTNYARVPVGKPCVMTVRTYPTELKASIVIDGVRTDYTKTTPTTTTSMSAANWQIGRSAFASTGQSAHSNIAQEIAYSRAISDAENDGLIAWLLENPAPSYCPPDLPLVMISGDSIAFGLNLNRDLIWSFKAQQQINAARSTPINLVNASIAGHTIGLQTLDYPTKMQPFRNAAREKNVFLAAIGTNDIATAGHDGPTTLADYYAFLDAKLADGWDAVIPCTILPRTHSSAFNTARAYFNTHLMAEWEARGYSRPANVAAIPGMGADGDDLDLDKYYDGVHPTQAGNDLLEVEYRAAMLDAIGEEDSGGGGGEPGGGEGPSGGSLLTVQRLYDGSRVPPLYVFSLPGLN